MYLYIRYSLYYIFQLKSDQPFISLSHARCAGSVSTELVFSAERLKTNCTKLSHFRRMKNVAHRIEQSCLISDA